MNLITGKWIPVLRKSGPDIIAPWEIVDRFDADPVIAFNLARPDFNGAMVQFLIGLLQTCCPPVDDDEWSNWMTNPPAGSELEALFMDVKPAFEFDGDGPRFMQDWDKSVAELEPKSIGALLIEEPGDQTLKFNKDLFVKRGGYPGLSYPMAVMALFTLQLNAPAGGAGHRTSLRGGGPLTTLMLPKKSNALWWLVWGNVSSVSERLPKVQNWDRELEKIFPWMGPTRTSVKSEMITPIDTHPLQVFWAMPRRIRIDFDFVTDMECAISGACEKCVTRYSTQNYGGNYGAWRHPLSPHYKKGTDELPMHPNVGGMTYRHWVGWSFGRHDGNSTVMEASVVSLSGGRSRRRHVKELWSFGYDMDNMKARGWQEAKIPVFDFEKSDTDGQSMFINDVECVVKAAEESCSFLRKQTRIALGSDSTPDSLDREFWGSTEAPFRNMLQLIYDQIEANMLTTPSREKWFEILQNSVLALFDKWTSSGNIEFENSERIIKSRKVLHSKKTKEILRRHLRIEETKNG